MSDTRPPVVVIGGGYDGLAVAKRLHRTRSSLAIVGLGADAGSALAPPVWDRDAGAQRLVVSEPGTP